MYSSLYTTNRIVGDYMKFDDIPASGNGKGGKGNNNLMFILIVAVVVILFVVLIVYSIVSSKSNNGKVVQLDTNSRLVQSLYTSVHDFKSNSPYWMYEGENSPLIVNMTESNKMVLAYLNLKASDFLEADNCERLPQENFYGKLVCSDKTIITKEDVERSYREVFGDRVTVNTTVNIKADLKYNTYVYNSEFDSYVLYSKGEDTTQKDSKYKYVYKIYNAESQGDEVRVYEELTVENTSTGTVENQSKYRYTFVLGDDNIYSYTSIEKLA